MFLKNSDGTFISSTEKEILFEFQNGKYCWRYIFFFQKRSTILFFFVISSVHFRKLDTHIDTK